MAITGLAMLEVIVVIERESNSKTAVSKLAFCLDNFMITPKPFHF